MLIKKKVQWLFTFVQGTHAARLDKNAIRP